MTLRFDSHPVPTPTRPDWAGLARVRGKTGIASGMADAFRAAGEAVPARQQLLDGDALCVTTGQQPGLLTGPLYTIYKGLSAAAFAQHATRVLGRPVVPVFWVGGDDHDFAEGNHLQHITAAGAVERIVLRERPSDAPLTPLYREPAGPEIVDVIERVFASTPETEFRQEIRDWVERHYRPEATLGGAFRDALAELLGPFGIVVFDPTDASAKRAMAPLLLRSMQEAGMLDAALAERGAWLTAEGRAAPVTVGDGATLVMLEASQGRDRLMLDGKDYVTRRSGERWTTAKIRDVAEREPQRLSPNVLLRPVVEAALLPTLAYVAGPGELAYLPQAEPVYRTLGVEPQHPVGRWAARFVEPRVQRVLDKYDLTADDLDRPEGQLESALLQDAIPPEGREALVELRASLDRGYGALVSAAMLVDPTLKKPVESARNAALSGLGDVERRLVAHLKQKNDILMGQLAKARASLFPMGHPQERVLNVVSFLVRYGPAFLTAAREAAQGHADALEAAAPST